MQQTPDTNPQVPEPSSQFTVEAKQLVDELAQKPGKKALIIIVDDLAIKRQGTLNIFQAVAEKREAGYAFSAKATGEDTVGLYEAFRGEDSKDNPTPVVLVIDSTLVRQTDPTPYKTGGDVASKILEISEANGWQKPYLVGNATEDAKHKEWEKMFPTFIAGYITESAPVFDAIESHL